MTTRQPTHVDVEVYLTVEPQWKNGSWHRDDQGRLVLDGGKVVKATQSRPGKVQNAAVVTKLTLRFPASSFLPLSPEAIIEIRPEDAEIIHVEASDPGASDE